MQEYLTPDQIADRYQISSHAVRKWCRTGKLKAIQIGTLWRIAPDDLEEFIRNSKRKVKEDSEKVNGLAA